MRAVLVADVDHAILGVRFAVSRLLDAHNIEGRQLRAGGMCTAFVVDVYHAILGMHLTVRRLAALDIERGNRFARLNQATRSAHIDHAVHGMPFAESPRLAAFHVKRRPQRACGMGAPRMRAYFISNVDHSIFCMQLAVSRLAVLDIERRSSRAGGM